MWAGLWRMLTEPKMILMVENCFTNPVFSPLPFHLYADIHGNYWLATSNSHWAFREATEPEHWFEMERRRLSSAASLPPNSSPY